MRCLRLQFPQRRREDHRALVGVRVHQDDPPAPGPKRGLEDRHDRRDPAAPGDQQEIGVERAGGKGAGRRQHVENCACDDLSDNPVRCVTGRHPLDCEARRLTSHGRTAQRVAAGDRAAVRRRHPHGDELPAPVREGRGELARHGQHERAGLLGLGDHLGHRHLVEGAVASSRRKYLDPPASHRVLDAVAQAGARRHQRGTAAARRGRGELSAASDRLRTPLDARVPQAELRDVNDNPALAARRPACTARAAHRSRCRSSAWLIRGRRNSLR